MLKSRWRFLGAKCDISILQFLRSFQLQFVYGERISLQATGRDREELSERLDVLLYFENGFRGHPADLFLDLLLFLDKLLKVVHILTDWTRQVFIFEGFTVLWSGAG